MIIILSIFLIVSLIYIYFNKLESARTNNELVAQLDEFRPKLVNLIEERDELKKSAAAQISQYNELNRVYQTQREDLEKVNRQINELLEHKSADLKAARESAVATSKAVSRGLYIEEFCPFLEGFKHNPKDARLLSHPIDLIIFSNMYKNQIDGIHFVEVKTAGAVLTERQKQIRDCIASHKVYWEEFRVK